jgi:alpha-1,2-mannosyltransferase
VLKGWVPALASLALAVAYGLYIALRTYEVDLGVYLRLGGKYVFTSHLYSFVLPNTSLPFTYPPFAALLFAPWQRSFHSVGLVQAVWTMGNLVALIGVLVLSVRLVRPSLGRMATWRLALALTLPALLLNPVLITIGFGQVNLFVTFLVMWDLLSERRIGKRQLPLGIATGLAAAVKLTPLLFLPYLVLTRRWRGALTAAVTFGACELLTYAVSPASSKAYWTQAVFKPGRAGDLSIVDNQNLWGVLDRFTHGLLPDAVMLPLLLLAAAGGLWLAAQAHRRSSPFLGVLICAATCLIVSPISWVHHMVWVVPAIIWLALAPDRPRWGRPLAAATAVLFWSAPVWWVPYKNTSDLHLKPLQLIAGNSFFLAMLVFLAGAAVLVIRRGTVRTDETIRLTRLPT